METGPRFIVPSDGLEKPRSELATPGLQGEWHNHCTTEASEIIKVVTGFENVMSELLFFIDVEL